MKLGQAQSRKFWDLGPHQVFLSGQDPTKHVPHYEKEDSTIMRRFLDPVTTSGHNDSTDEIVELKTRDSEMHFEAPEAQRDAGGQHGGNSSWDVEADGANNKSFFHKEGGGYHDGMGIFCFLANLWPACRSRVSRNFTKRLKDGEEQSNSPSQMEVSHAALVMLHLPCWLFVSLKYFYLFSPHINAFPIKPKSYTHW